MAKQDAINIELIDYTPTKLTQKKITDIKECAPYRHTKSVTWLNLVGLDQVSTIKKIGETFGIHHLTTEDILSPNQPPKIEELRDYLFVELNMLTYQHESDKLISNPVSIILNPNFVISFRDYGNDVFHEIRQKIGNEENIIRKMGTDYLVYSLISAITDNYFDVLEHFTDKIDRIEDELLKTTNTDSLKKMHILRREMLILKKSVWPLREILSNLQQTENKLITSATKVYFRNLYEHIIQVLDTIEIFREIISNMLELYLSSMSNRMNEVIKLLTVVATIFMPMTFVTGLYGMNFRYMPELGWRYGYLFAWGMMLVAVLLMVLYFKRKKWM